MTETRPVEFPGADGSTLVGRLELPDRPPRATALFAHCFTCGKDVAAASRIARRRAPSSPSPRLRIRSTSRTCSGTNCRATPTGTTSR